MNNNYKRSLMISIIISFALLITPVGRNQQATTLAAPSNQIELYLPLTYKTVSSQIPNPSPTPTSLPPIQSDGSWPMAGSNPERTSWTPEEVRTRSPLWFKPFEAYILPKVQIITANDTLYISTSKGLYALDAENGNQRWVYPTELPLGHSPTINNGIAYVGCFDHKLHAINALTGEGLWTFEAGAGFETNPLVVNDKVFLGNRDGWFYAVHISGPNTGELAWKFQTQGPVLYSAAYKDGVIFFASNDSHAYALDFENGDLVWNSAKLVGAGFHSWWPVVYRDRVIFSGSNSYRLDDPGTGKPLHALDKEEVFPNFLTDPRGTLYGTRGTEPGDWVEGTVTIKANAVIDYFNNKPWRKSYFVLDRFSGEERETSPILWAGTHSGNRYPPVIGSDSVLYQQNSYMSDPYITGGQVSGWKIGTPYISVISSDWGAVDEPHAAAAGGDLIYWNLCCDRQAGAIDITIPNSSWVPPRSGRDGTREWLFFNYDLPSVMPGYDLFSFHDYSRVWMVYGSPDGVYGYHGDTNPPIPYKGKIYMHRSNAILAFGEATDQLVELPIAEVVEVHSANLTVPTEIEIRDQLAEQVNKIINAGHLMPGHIVHGMFDIKGRDCADKLIDYFHHPGDTLTALLRALPYLPADLQESTRVYIQTEFTNYPPYQYNHIGWLDGTSRDLYDYPPEFNTDRNSFPPQTAVYNFEGWTFAPHSFYALWLYAKEFGNAINIYESSHHRLTSPPNNDLLIREPHVLNAFIAGYIGYLELEKLAGRPETPGVRLDLDQLLELRVSSFSINSAYEASDYCRTLTTGQNFMYLVPELAEYMQDHLESQIQMAVNEYGKIVPYWFVSGSSVTFGEGVIHPMYDSFAIFQARAKILGESRQTLSRYLDVPGFYVGDLFYIEKLIYILEAET